MSKRASTLEWHVAENDTDWMHLCAQTPLDRMPSAEPTAQGRLFSKRFLWEVATLLLLLASAGGWWWRSALAELHQVDADVRATVQQEFESAAHGDDSLPFALSGDPATTDAWHQVAQAASSLRTDTQTTPPAAPLDGEVSAVAVQGDLAVAHVFLATAQGTPVSRQTRFYRRIGPDWRQTAPAAALWGPERSLETPSFIFHFRQNDSRAVIAVAPQIEALYTTLRHNVGLPIIPIPDKLVIEVSVTQPPGQTAPWFVGPDRFLVPSPAVYLAPVELTDAELLAQSIALPLLAHGLAQAHERHQIGLVWQPLLSGLHLWQVWDLDLPLAAWREDIVQWLYVDVPATPPGQPVVLPERYRELCAAHRLWMPSPAQMGIPLVCTELDQDAWFFSSWDPHDPLTRLDHFSVPAPKSLVVPPFPVVQLGQTVALATLIEYAAATYGRERPPALLAGLGQYDRWDTLLPAVYGVSSAEFEVGWQTYLAAHYGVRRSSQRSALDPHCARSQESAGEGKDRRIAFSQNTGCST